jgi:hypothetical protein
MKTIQVFDPALCCSSGVCGTDVDQALVDFSADVDWAKQQGAVIERFNLAQQPMAFAEKKAVKDLLHKSGESALPVVLLDGQVMITGSYPTREVLAGWLGATLAASYFTPQVAELVAIGASIASNCEPCFKFNFDAARKLGVSDADMLRAVELAQKVKNSPATAVLDLAHRYLQSSTATVGDATQAGGGCCGGSDKSAKSSAGCCGGEPQAAKSAGACCGEATTATAQTAAKCC